MVFLTNNYYFYFYYYIYYLSSFILSTSVIEHTGILIYNGYKYNIKSNDCLSIDIIFEYWKLMLPTPTLWKKNIQFIYSITDYENYNFFFTCSEFLKTSNFKDPVAIKPVAWAYIDFLQTTSRLCRKKKENLNCEEK